MKTVKERVGVGLVWRRRNEGTKERKRLTHTTDTEESTLTHAETAGTIKRKHPYVAFIHVQTAHNHRYPHVRVSPHVSIDQHAYTLYTQRTHKHAHTHTHTNTHTNTHAHTQTQTNTRENKQTCA